MAGILVEATPKQKEKARVAIEQYNNLLQKEIARKENMNVKNIASYALTIVRQYMIIQIGLLYDDEFMIDQNKNKPHEVVDEAYIKHYKKKWNGE